MTDPLPSADENIRTFEVERDGLRFVVRDEGPADGPPVLLLHGFPEGIWCWDPVVALMVDAGFRVLRFAQRGYAAAARPEARAAYRLAELEGDVLAVLDAAGVDKVHLVGHDWGGLVAWAMAVHHPESLASLTVLSTPHPAAYGRAMLRSSQGLRALYALGFQVPVLSDKALTAGGGEGTRRALRRSGMPAWSAERSAALLCEPGAARAMLNWYRVAAPDARNMPAVRDVPTTYLWGSGDGYLGRYAAEATADFVDAPYRFEALGGRSHWLTHEVPDLVVDSVRRHDADGS